MAVRMSEKLGEVRPDNVYLLIYAEGKAARLQGLPRETKRTGFERQCWLAGWDEAVSDTGHAVSDNVGQNLSDNVRQNTKGGDQ